MRIRVLHSTAQLDGIDLSVFQPDQVYEIDPSLATYLVVSGVAEPNDGNSPALVVRTEEVMTGVGVFVGPTPRADVVDDCHDLDEPACI